MSTTRRWRGSPRSISCAPRSSANRDPTPNLAVSPSARSPRPPTSGAAATGSPLPTLTPRSSTPRWRLIVMRFSPSGSAITAMARALPISGPRCRAPPRAFMRLVEAGWDAEATRRPHGQHTTVVVHLDVEQRAAGLHLGPLLSDADRRYLTCDATCEVWFERAGEVIGAGRATRLISRRLRRALEYRQPTCAVPGCGVTRGLHAHHLRHWEDGGPTELANLVLLCPYHHRCH